jgi:hypothetical protein
MTETNATRPTHQGGAQSHSAQIDAAAAEKMLSMARSICRHGYLHRYVPAQPRWCRRIGDQIGLALSRQQEVHPLDLERLAFVFKKAQAQQKTKVINRKPTRGMALRLARARQAWAGTLDLGGRVADGRDHLDDTGLGVIADVEPQIRDGSSVIPQEGTLV